MTDITKYKNVSLSHETYNILDQIRKVLVPNTTLSRSQTINVLVKEKAYREQTEMRDDMAFFVLNCSVFQLQEMYNTMKRLRKNEKNNT